MYEILREFLGHSFVVTGITANLSALCIGACVIYRVAHKNVLNLLYCRPLPTILRVA